MKTKYVRIPFEVELAKKITNGECDGKIVTRDGRNARVVCWDVEGWDDYVLALLSNEKHECPVNFMPNGCMVKDERTKSDLMIEIPEYMTFKDGDIIKLSNDTYTWLSIIKDIDLADDGKGGVLYFTNDYVSILINDGDGSVDIDTYSDGGRNVEKATEEEKQKLIEALKSSKNPKAKEYLKRFFPNHSNSSNIGKNFEFKFKQDVLVRQNEKDLWCGAQFSHKELNHYVVFGGSYFLQCVPYNEQTAHLLGTTENYE